MKSFLKISGLILLCLAFASCRQGGDDQPETVNPTSLQILAKTVTYDVIVKNPDPLDEWTEECLKDLDLKQLVNYVFDAVYQGSVKATDYHSGERLSPDEIRLLEEDYDRSRIGKVQFVEEWTAVKGGMEIRKRVRSVMLAYELYEEDGSVRAYKAGFVAHLMN